MVSQKIDNMDDIGWELEQPKVYEDEVKKLGGRPKKKKEDLKHHKYVLRLKDKEYEELKQYSEKYELSINDVVRLSIKNYIQGGYNPHFRK